MFDYHGKLLLRYTGRLYTGKKINRPISQREEIPALPNPETFL